MESMVRLGSRNKAAGSEVAKSSVTNDRSEARVDPLTALLVQGQTGKYQAGVSRATWTRQSRNQRQSNGSGQAADREDYQKAGRVREAGSKQSGEGVNSPGKTREDKLGKTLGNVSQGKNKTSHWVSVCVLLLCEWVNEVQVCWGNQGWWVNGDSCVIGVMVDGNVCVQCMMGDVVHGWCAVEVSGNQIHDTFIKSLTFCTSCNGDLNCS